LLLEQLPSRYNQQQLEQQEPKKDIHNIIIIIID